MTDLIDVVKDQQQNYVPEVSTITTITTIVTITTIIITVTTMVITLPTSQEDPTVFVSEKTARGPLDENWLEEYSAACVVSWHDRDHLYIMLMYVTKNKHFLRMSHEFMVPGIFLQQFIKGDVENTPK